MAERPAGDWATEKTLQDIRSNTKATAYALQSLLKIKGGVADLGDSARAAAKDVTKGGMSFKDALKDVKGGMTKWKEGLTTAGIKGFGQQVGKTGSLLGSLSSNAGGLLGTFGSVAKMAGPIGMLVSGISFAVGVIQGLVEQLYASKDAFVDLVQNGIMFNGSLIDFNVAVGKAGLTTAEFANIAAQSGQGIRAFGEAKFLDATTRLSKTFGEFGLNITKGNEYFAEYLETSRLAGNVYIGSMADQRIAFEENIRQQHELAILTGKSVSEQKKAARARAESAQYKVMMAALPEAERKRMEAVAQHLDATGMDQQMVRSAIVQERFGKPSAEYSKLKAMMPELENLGEYIRNTPIDQMGKGIENLATSFTQATQDTGRMQQMLMLFGTSVNSTVESIANMMSGMNAVVNMPEEYRKKLEELRKGGSPYDKDLKALNDLQDAWKSFTTNVNAAIMQFIGDTGGKMLLGWINDMGTAVRTFIAADPGQKMQEVMKYFQFDPQSGLMKAAKEWDEAKGFWEVLKASGKVLQEAFAPIWETFRKTLDEWTDTFVEKLRQILPAWLRGAPTEKERQTGFKEQQEQQLRSQGLPVAPPPLPERPPIDMTERNQQIQQLNDRINVLSQQILDLQPRAATREDTEELRRLNETMQESVRALRQIRDNQ